ncbi:MAG: 4-(cytidine 5'-diphospho)-2-C-methyl-D-erythritol kinase [Propionibacteriales bacterium]|nr:4-(cytidine 5'-diphospho)-2-C-methyl-D-erythritol kinase [Propionibacteriales bacterium]
MDGVTVRAPAKLNLSLRVGPRRADGYHPLATVFQAVELYDSVKARPAEDGEFEITVSGDDAGLVPADGDNLAMRAARLLAADTGVAHGVRLHVHKSIPVAGGMAGGSADAAGALVACDALWGTRVDRETMLKLAAQLGSDVPFCVVGGTAIGSGRGEQVSPVLARGRYDWVIAIGEEGMATPGVYSEVDRLRAGREVSDPVVPSDIMSALRAGDAEALGRALSNDLQPAAVGLRPDLAGVLDVGIECGALGSMVSGSGPTCVFLAGDDSHAIDIATALTATGVCRAVRRAAGPVSGPRVVG